MMKEGISYFLLEDREFNPVNVYNDCDIHIYDYPDSRHK